MTRSGKWIETQPSARPQLLPGRDWSAVLTGWVAAAMTFLAVLSFAAGLAALRLAADWRADVAGTATVWVAPEEGEAQPRIAAVVEVLRTTPGIASVRVLSDEEQAALLVPWLGESVALADLPAARLIDVQLEGRGPDAEALQNRLDLTVRGAVYDDHASWREPLAQGAEALTRLAFSATALVLVTAAAMVAYAARATLAANVQTVALVRLIGGSDRFIMDGFVNRLARHVAIGAAVGAAAGCIALLMMPSVESDTGMAVSLMPGVAGWVLLALGPLLLAVLTGWAAARGAIWLALRRLP